MSVDHHDRFFGLAHPVLQAPVAGVGAVPLAIGVANVGAMGSVAMTWTEPEEARRAIEGIRSATDGLFFANFVLSFEPLALDAVLEARVPAVTFSWGEPGALVAKVQHAGARVGIQTGTVDGAIRAIDQGADFVICQGVEAGGHVQSTIALQELLPAVVARAGSTPVVAAGGLSDGHDIAWALSQGASAAMLGTRFVATVESDAHPQYKQALVDAKTMDSVYTLCFDGEWPYAAHRVLRNRTLHVWESAGCPPPGKRPGEGDVVARAASGERIKRYSSETPGADMRGDILEGCLYAGAGCGKITDIPTAAELLERLDRECRQAFEQS